jgi:polysaccharide biosynthesis protein PelA
MEINDTIALPTKHRFAIPPSSVRLRFNRASALLKVVLVLCAGWPLLFVRCVQDASAEFFYVDYSSNVSPVHLRLYDVSIISPEAKVDLSEGHKLGHEFFSYLSIGEVAADATYREEVIRRKIPLFGKNEIWQSDLVDLSHPDWAQFMIELAGDAVRKHFDGFFLDTVDTVELLIQKYPERAETFRSGLVSLIKKLRAAYPDKKIIINRGFSVYDQLRGTVDGMLIESVFQTFDGATQAYAAVAPSETEHLLREIRKVKEAGFTVYILDYVDPGDRKLARQTAQRIENLGYHALVTTIELEGRVLAPLVAKRRHLLALFGNHSSQLSNSIKYPTDSFVAKNVQMVLEWLGYEVDYLDAVRDAPPTPLDAKYCGILLDRFLDIPRDKEEALADWLLAQKDHGVKLIFLGDIHFTEEETKRRVLKALGIRGSGSVLARPKDIQIQSLAEGMMNYETKVRLVPQNMRDLKAPPEASVSLSLSFTDHDRACEYDPLFTTSWGGMALDPFMTLQRPDFLELWIFDPFQYFSSALGLEAGPVPDTTTRDGLRILYSHIDGDGFGNMSVVEAGRRSAEIIRDQVIKVYPIPITFSIIEAEIRGRLIGQTPGDEQTLREIARSIFALPNVQAGSHSYTHPFFWMENDRTAMAYEGQSLVLSDAFAQGELDLSREIAGSVKFIDDELLPPGKKVSVFLWSGNCRPPPEAIRMTRELGLENMNGGETLISARYPSISSVSPRSIAWGGEVQVYAANQNENIFNDNWQGPYYGGYIHTIETFKRTETPRRLKPMNIYYHLFCGDYPDATKVLRQVYEYALSQPAHALTAVQYAELVRDSRETTIIQKSDRHWILMNRGYLRTFRMAARGMVPDLVACQGVTGFNEGADVLYIHTDGSPKVDLVLSSKPPRHPYLISSTSEIRFQQLSTNQVEFTATDLRAITVALGGLPENFRLNVTVNQESRTPRSDAEGRLTLALPPDAHVTIPELGGAP